MSTLEMYRESAASVGHSRLASLDPKAREAALRTQLQHSPDLHPALLTPDGHYRVGCVMHTRVCIHGHMDSHVHTHSFDTSLTYTLHFSLQKDTIG
jgi:hypothetical protein